jgi:ppGpp synthetase/RelA/SpoT-type nucleotidyltranferase
MPHRPDGPLTGADIVPAGRPDAPELAWKAKAADELAQVLGSQHRQVAEATVEALLEALHHEADMTSQLLASVGSGPARLVGLEWRLKSPVSLARKIRDRAIEKRLTPAQAAKELADTIRYTVTTDKQTDLIPTLIKATNTLLARGWTVREAEESFVRDNPYKGIHLILSAPTGHQCEVQFHTQSAFERKQLGHIDYEIYRDVDKPFQVRLKAFNKSVELWSDVATPPGLRKLKVLGGVQIKSKKYSPPHGSEGDRK